MPQPKPAGVCEAGTIMCILCEIGQEADIVIFIDRPAMYGIREFDGWHIDKAVESVVFTEIRERQEEEDQQAISLYQDDFETPLGVGDVAHGTPERYHESLPDGVVRHGADDVHQRPQRGAHFQGVCKTEYG